ncbi:hypothetical protein ABMA28_002631 [Loxostege sticticalis]|uniref:DUF4817 domain-containing protein n=1 Tax=Loxostege sticticalis TaxID=481309 RepID=A0ABD0SXH6_LOXSC
MFLRNNSSVIRTQREFRRRFPHRPAPIGRTIRRFATRLEATGSTLDRPKSGRPRTGRSAENIDAVREYVEECPETSTRRRATQLGISRRTLQRILVKDLKMFPYKTQMTHQLLPADHRARLDYCQRVINLNLEEDDFPSKLVMKTPLHPLKVTVWCGICVDRVIGPYFFEDAGGNAITVTGERYRTMLREFLIPSLDELGLEHIWFQQDGATAHTARDTMDLVRDAFPGRVISRFGDLPWPARSPDLTSPDFFLWGFLKSRVYVNKPQTLAALKENIRQEITNISQEVLRQIMQNVINRAQMCINSGGHHLKVIIFKS